MELRKASSSKNPSLCGILYFTRKFQAMGEINGTCQITWVHCMNHWLHIEWMLIRQSSLCSMMFAVSPWIKRAAGKNNRGEKYSRATAWKGEAKGEGSLITSFSPIPFLNCPLLSFHPNHSSARCVIMVMVLIAFTRTPRSEKINILFGGVGAKSWVRAFKLQSLSFVPGVRHGHQRLFDKHK